MKGVLLAGGTGSRLYPLTLVTNKHLMPVFDRPMIYFPLQTLRDMGIDKVMVILGGKSIGDIVELLSDGRDFDLDLTYRYQRGALGIAHGIGLAREFVGDDSFCVVLGDNVLQGEPLADVAAEFEAGPWGAGALLHRVPDPERFGVAEFDASGKLVGFEEKPAVAKSDSIPIGVYFLRPDAFGVIEHLQPSNRGEFEITDVLNHYLADEQLFWRHYEGMWTDAGSIDSLLRASTLASEAGATSEATASGGAPLATPNR
jgi:glucose-1-phosphate thymidylyltransferase